MTCSAYLLIYVSIFNKTNSSLHVYISFVSHKFLRKVVVCRSRDVTVQGFYWTTQVVSLEGSAGGGLWWTQVLSTEGCSSVAVAFTCLLFPVYSHLCPRSRPLTGLFPKILSISDIMSGVSLVTNCNQDKLKSDIVVE